MTRFYPDKYLAQVLPKGFSEKGLLFDNLNPRKTYLRALYRVAGKEGKALQSTVYETIRTYQQKEEALQAAGVADYAQVAVNNQALLKSRVENFLIWNKVQEEKSAHSGQFYRWLPSDAEHPDPEHQLLYGKIFQVGKGDKDGNMPGERYGCRCGIEWLDSNEQKQAELKETILSNEEKVLRYTTPNFIKRVESMFENATQGRNLTDRNSDIVFRTVKGREARRLFKDTGMDFTGYKYQLRTQDMRHGIADHSDLELERLRGQRPVTAQDYALTPHITQYYDKVIVQKRKAGLRLKFIKKIGNEYSYVVVVTNPSKGKGAFFINKTLFVKT